MEKLVFLIKTLPLPQFPQKKHLHWAQLKSLDFFFPVDSSQVSTPLMKELLPDKALVTKIPRKSQIPGIFSMENWNIFLSRKAGFAGTTWDKWEVLLSTHPNHPGILFLKKVLSQGWVDAANPGIPRESPLWNSQVLSQKNSPGACAAGQRGWKRAWETAGTAGRPGKSGKKKNKIPNFWHFDAFFML